MSSLLLRVGSSEFTPTSWSFEESVWKYCPELRFTLRSALPSDVFTFGDSDVSWVVISCVGSGDDKYDYVCYPKSFWDQCNVVSDCVNGDYTLPELCSVLGLPFYNGHSGSSFSRFRWVLPRLRGIKLLDALTLGGACLGGGCSTLHYDASGGYIFNDLLLWSSSDLSSSRFSFLGRGGSPSLDRGWQTDVPGVVDFYFDGDGGVGSLRRELFRGNSGVGGFHLYMSNDSVCERRVWESRNRFWRSFFRGSLVQFSGVQIVGGYIGAGCLCRHMDAVGESGRGYICCGYRTAYSGSVQDITLDCVLV